MRAPLLATVVGFVAVFATAFAASAAVPDVDQAVQDLSMRMKDVEALGARFGKSVFSFPLAGLLTGVGSSVASSYLTPADFEAAKQFTSACSNDISTLCATEATQPTSGLIPDWFAYNRAVMDCLEDNFRDVSDQCIVAAHVASNYIHANKDTIRLTLKQVAVKDSFTSFQTLCASEIAAQCPAGVTDPSGSLASLIAPSASEGEEQTAQPAAPAAGHGQGHSNRQWGERNYNDRRLHWSEGERHGHHGGKATRAVDQLSSSLGSCVSAVVDDASATCSPAVEALTHVASFVTRKHGDWRRLNRDSHRSLWSGQQPPADSSSEEEGQDGGNFRGHRGGHGKKNDGGIFGVLLIVAVIALAVSACRRRRQMRTLQERVHQLELALARVTAPMGVPVPQQVFVAQQPRPTRPASEATEEHSGLLGPQVVQGYPYPVPGSINSYPGYPTVPASAPVTRF